MTTDELGVGRGSLLHGVHHRNPGRECDLEAQREELVDVKRAEPREDVLIVATKPCWVCVEEAERRGVDALRLCNRKRRRAFAEKQRSDQSIREWLAAEDTK